MLQFTSPLARASHLVSLTELKTEVHQVLHPDEAVGILVTHVENLFKPPQKLQELLLVGKNMSFHCGAGFVGGSLIFPSQMDCRRIGMTVAIIAHLQLRRTRSVLL